MGDFKTWFEAITEPKGLSPQTLSLMQQLARMSMPGLYSIISQGDEASLQNSSQETAGFIPAQKLLILRHHQIVDPVIGKSLMQLKDLPEFTEYTVDAVGQRMPLSTLNLKTIVGKYKTFAKQSSKHFPYLSSPYKKPGYWAAAPGPGRKMNPDASSTKRFAIRALFDLFDVAWYHIVPDYESEDKLDSILKVGLKPSIPVLNRRDDDESQTGISGGLNVETQQGVYVYIDPQLAEEKAKAVAPAIILKIDSKLLNKDHSKLLTDEDALRPGDGDPVNYGSIRHGNSLTMPHFLRSASKNNWSSFAYAGTIPPSVLSVYKIVRAEKDD